MNANPLIKRNITLLSKYCVELGFRTKSISKNGSVYLEHVNSNITIRISDHFGFGECNNMGIVVTNDIKPIFVVNMNGSPNVLHSIAEAKMFIKNFLIIRGSQYQVLHSDEAELKKVQENITNSTNRLKKINSSIRKAKEVKEELRNVATINTIIDGLGLSKKQLKNAKGFVKTLDAYISSNNGLKNEDSK